MKCAIIVVCILLSFILLEMIVFSYFWFRGYMSYVTQLKYDYRISAPNSFMNDHHKHFGRAVDLMKNLNEIDHHRMNYLKKRLNDNLLTNLESNQYKGPAVRDNPYELTDKQCVNTTNVTTYCEFYNRLKNEQILLNKYEHRFLSWLSPTDRILEERYNTCAIVTSAGALLGSGRGSFIDTHELVLRFNNAPTRGYENDVGSKTTMRVLNSQILTNPTFDFLNSSLYRNIVLLIWDPAKNTSTLEQWIDNPEHNFVDSFKTYRRKYNSDNIHLYDPFFLWRMWFILHCDTNGRIKYNPPSSGFLALTFLLPRCNLLRMFEYMPTKVTDRCHYYSDKMNKYCTYGTWHPLAAEKLFAYRINVAEDKQVFGDGYLSYDQNVIGNCKYL